jgi:hypothetical protein
MKTNLDIGLTNLLQSAINLQRGQRVLLVQENPKYGWYDSTLPKALYAFAVDKLGAVVEVLEVEEPTNSPHPKLEQMLKDQHWDWIIFLARIGDQDRFEANHQGPGKLMTYTRTMEQLQSGLGTVPHEAMVALKTAVNGIFDGAQHIEITCPFGTQLQGKLPKPLREKPSDVAVVRFPAAVSKPISARTFSGRVAFRHGLSPTGSKVYSPPCLPLPQGITAVIDKGEISSFEGAAADIKATQDHYRQVANQLNIEPWLVDSWHLGLHPATTYPLDPQVDLDRWSNTMFTSTRYMHFHTCGNYPPGEICGMVEDPTVKLDGVALWQDGHLMATNFSAIAKVLQCWPQLGPL